MSARYANRKKSLANRLSDVIVILLMFCVLYGLAYMAFPPVQAWTNAQVNKIEARTEVRIGSVSDLNDLQLIPDSWSGQYGKTKNRKSDIRMRSDRLYAIDRNAEYRLTIAPAPGMEDFRIGFLVFPDELGSGKSIIDNGWTEPALLDDLPENAPRSTFLTGGGKQYYFAVNIRKTDGKAFSGEEMSAAGELFRHALKLTKLR